MNKPTTEDLDYRSEDILNKAGFDPADIDTYMKVFNDHGDTSDIKQMNMKEKVSRKGKNPEDENRSDGDKFIDDVLVMSNGCDNSSKIKKLEEQMEQVHQTLKSLKLETIIK